MTENESIPESGTDDTVGHNEHPAPSAQRPTGGALSRLRMRQRTAVRDTAAATDTGTAAETDVINDNAGVTSPVSQPRRGRIGAVSICIVSIAAMIAAVATGYLKYQYGQATAADRAITESVQVAKDDTVAMLSYTPDTAQAKLTAARDLLTGTFRESYTSLTHDVVIPGAQQKQISATATVPAAASVSASASHAVVVVFVNQAIVMGNGAPTQSSSVVQVTLDKAGNRWLVSGFDPK